MTRRFISALLALALLPAAFLVLSIDPAPAGAQGTPAVCPATLPTQSSELVCQCYDSAAGSAVWGTDFYTDDSNLCAAAVHAGAIPDSGGTVSVRVLPGRESYSGSTRNGIETRDYARWGRTLAFEGAGAFASVALCPGTYNANGTGWSGTCRCESTGSGAVWGSNVYTADSSLCRAARHAGVIGPSGGVVHVAPAAGRSSYAGSMRNGVTTSSWGSFGASFTVGN